MNVLGIDVGGTKIAGAVFNDSGICEYKESVPVDGKTGASVGKLITGQIERLLQKSAEPVCSVGVSVPGISYAEIGSVWAPNIPGWENYPLRDEIRSAISNETSVVIDSDRACYILGETWQGCAKGCKNAVFIAVGTGIGAGILVNGSNLRGANDIAGAIGWMALDRPFSDSYKNCGCFESHASGVGIAKEARRLIRERSGYSGELNSLNPGDITAHDVFEAFENKDPIAVDALDNCIEFWGMAAANLVSIFDPEMIVFGGGVFGPAIRFLDRIRDEASRWAQPVSMAETTFKASALGDDAGLIGAGRLALMNCEL